jgi:hypothetical protein
MIERQIYKALYELERMQRTRGGEKITAPLAIDVNLTPTGLKVGGCLKMSFSKARQPSGRVGATIIIRRGIA